MLDLSLAFDLGLCLLPLFAFLALFRASFASSPPPPPAPAPDHQPQKMITNDIFWANALLVLRAIADADFVAIDGEFTGLAPQCLDELGKGKPALDQAYAEAKDSAERFSLAQIGITCVTLDLATGTFVARPFSLAISPEIPHGDRHEVKRNTYLCSGAIEFLKKNGNNLWALLRDGVTFYSRTEETQARAAFEKKQMRIHMDISLDDNTRPFYQVAKDQIEKWLLTAKPDDSSQDDCEIRISGLPQKRAVYQLVRNEFPLLRAWPEQDQPLMHILFRNEEDEMKHAAGKRTVFEEEVKKAIGLRYIWEALTGGDLSTIDPVWLRARGSWTSQEDIENEYAEVVAKLKTKKTVLVGHNLLTDLCFLCRAFEGSLPSSVLEFKKQMHKLCPLIFDTKFMATYINGSSESGFMRHAASNSSLGEIYTAFRAEEPKLKLAAGFLDYEEQNAAHDAAYDSYVTAIIFVQMALRIQAELAAQPHSKTLAAAIIADAKARSDSLAAAKLAEARAARKAFNPKAKEFVPSGLGGSSRNDDVFSDHDTTLVEADGDGQSSKKRSASVLSQPGSPSKHRKTELGRIGVLDTADKPDQTSVGVQTAPKNVETHPFLDFIHDAPGLYRNKLRVYRAYESLCDLEI